MTSVALALARWAHDLQPAPEDLALADRSLLDTVAVALAARDSPVTGVAAIFPDAARWAVAGHVLDFDDLHMPSTTHVSAVCVPTSLALDGGARGYLAGAGVMARLGTRLAALLGRLARHVHSRGTGQRRRGGGSAGAARGADRHGHGARGSR